MKTRIPLVLGLLLAVTPATVAAQAESSPAPAADVALVSQLCAAAEADPAGIDACVASVEAALQQMAGEAPAEAQSLLDQAASLVDDTLEDLRQIDVEAAFDDLVASVQDIEIDVQLEEIQQTVDEAIADAQNAIEAFELPSQVDLQAALDEAVAEALATAEEIDLQAAVDDALAEARTAIEEADLQGAVDEAVVALEEGVVTARAVVAEAQQWAQENRDAVCRGGSVSLGTTVGVAVFVVTGVEWLGLQAFLAIERFTNAACGDVVGE